MSDEGGKRRLKAKRAGRKGGRKRNNDVDGAGGSRSLSGSTKIPVVGADALQPDVYLAIKSEAFRKGMTVVHFMEHIVLLGWQHYTKPPVIEEGARACP